MPLRAAYVSRTMGGRPAKGSTGAGNGGGDTGGGQGCGRQGSGAGGRKGGLPPEDGVGGSKGRKLYTGVGGDVEEAEEAEEEVEEVDEAPEEGGGFAGSGRKQYFFRGDGGQSPLSRFRLASKHSSTFSSHLLVVGASRGVSSSNNDGPSPSSIPHLLRRHSVASIDI
eukprot:Sspe_Gene.38547::Locus_18578_Transcript_2_2_Confidence_0.500_Length_1645::g.38547::m.38547